MYMEAYSTEGQTQTSRENRNQIYKCTITAQAYSREGQAQTSIVNRNHYSRALPCKKYYSSRLSRALMGRPSATYCYIEASLYSM